MVNSLENINSAIYEASNSYYKRLSNIGFANQNTVDRLLVLGFLADILYEFPPLDEKDYNRIYKLWDCLAAKECMIPWEEYRKEKGKVITDTSTLKFRIAEGNLRVSNNQIRVTQL